MIKVRYCDLPGGMHASAKREGRRTILYLRPGLSPAERRSVIDRLRGSARVGHGPRLPAIPLALALTANRSRLNLRNAAAAVRLHPTGFAIPVVLIAVGAILYGLLVTVTMHFGRPSIPVPAVAQDPLPIATAPVSAGAAQPGPSPGPAVDPVPATHLPLGRSARPDRGVISPGGQVIGASPGPGTPTPGGGSSPPATPSPPSSPSPTPSPTHSHGGSGLCLNLLGLLGICVNL